MGQKNMERTGNEELCKWSLRIRFYRFKKRRFQNDFSFSIDRLERGFTQRAFHKPWLRLDWFFELSSLYRQEKQYISVTNTLIEKAIQNRREFPRSKGEK